MSTQAVLRFLKEHDHLPEFLDSLDFDRYPGLDLSAVFFWINTGVLSGGLPHNSFSLLLEDMRAWVSLRSHGGARPGAGARKRTTDIRRISLSAEGKCIARAKRYAKKNDTSLQALFREWLAEF